jgi:hypothetical protein
MPASWLPLAIATYEASLNEGAFVYHSSVACRLQRSTRRADSLGQVEHFRLGTLTGRRQSRAIVTERVERELTVAAMNSA